MAKEVKGENGGAGLRERGKTKGEEREGERYTQTRETKRLEGCAMENAHGGGEGRQPMERLWVLPLSQVMASPVTARARAYVVGSYPQGERQRCDRTSTALPSSKESSAQKEKWRLPLWRTDAETGTATGVGEGGGGKRAGCE